MVLLKYGSFSPKLHIADILSLAQEGEIWAVNTLRPRQNGRCFADDTFKCIFLNENVRISIKISLKFVPKGPINNIPALVERMAWRRSGDKPLSEPMMVSLLTHICVTHCVYKLQFMFCLSYCSAVFCYIELCYNSTQMYLVQLNTISNTRIVMKNSLS